MIGEDFADKMEEMFEQDLTASDEVTGEKWSQRPVLERIKEFFSRPACPLALMWTGNWGFLWVGLAGHRFFKVETGS